jgi:hypothetical protein
MCNITPFGRHGCTSQSDAMGCAMPTVSLSVLVDVTFGVHILHPLGPNVCARLSWCTGVCWGWRVCVPATLPMLTVPSPPRSRCWRIRYARGARCAPFWWRAARCWGYDVWGMHSFTPSNRTFPFPFPSACWCARMACSQRGVGECAHACCVLHGRHAPTMYVERSGEGDVPITPSTRTSMAWCRPHWFPPAFPHSCPMSVTGPALALMWCGGCGM